MLMSMLLAIMCGPCNGSGVIHTRDGAVTCPWCKGDGDR